MADEIVETEVEDETPIDIGDTDLASHHIEGYRNGSFVQIPLISHITGNLWSGGCIGGVTLPSKFKYVVSLYMWEKYALPYGCSRIEVEMYDSGTLPDEHLLHSLAELVVDLSSKAPTLVHCQAGLNRSGLISALALVTMGHEAEEAVALLREKRSPLVLCNKTFENWVLTH